MESSTAVQQLTPVGSDLGHSPVTIKPSSVDRSRGYEEGEPNAVLQRHNKFLKLDSEMQWAIVKTTDWMSTCLPGANSDADTAFQPFSVTLNKNEAAMYPGLCNGMNGILQQIDCTEFLTYCTAELPDNSVAESDTLDVMDTSALKVDISILPKKFAKLRTKVQKNNKPTNQPATGDQCSSSFPSSSSITPDATPPDFALNSSDVAAPAATTAASLSDDFASPLNAQETVSRHSQSERQPLRAECSWHRAEVLVEVKLNPKYFPFPQHDPMSQGAEHIQSRGQLASYALQVLRMQHRNHVFLISISGESARLVRFDRSGAIVSESFNCSTEAGVTFIGQFLYRLFCPSATAEDRGADATATPASDGDSEFFSSLHSRFPTGSASSIGKHFKKALGADGTWPIYTLNITSPWSKLGSGQTPLPVRKGNPLETHRCLVGKPMFTSRSLMGRGTKCFVGWDLDANRPVMIKDSWRADLKDIGSELDTYMTLWEGKTAITSTYIPTPLGGGDVYRTVSEGNTTRREYQRTLALTVPVLPNTPKSQRIPRIHTRLVLKEICESLENFTGAGQLVVVLFNALMGHFHAWNTHKILHRDISAYNILIYYPDDSEPNPTGDPEAGVIGLLSDWDLARTESQLQQGPVLPARSGTWQTMSSLLQFIPEKRYEVSDDLESFMHVLNWCALRFLPNEWSPSELAIRLHALFNFHTRQKLEDETFISIGALQRLKMISAGEPFATVNPPDHPFGGLLKDLAVLCQEHYATYNIDKVIANAQRLEDRRKQSAQPQQTTRKQNLFESIMEKSTMSLPFLAGSARGAKSTALPKPTTPTRASSSHLSGPRLGETLQPSNVVILNSPPTTPRIISRTIKDRSESPLLDHTSFMMTIMNILDNDIDWDILPKKINALEPQSVTSVLNFKGSESGSSTGGSKRPLAADDNDEHGSGSKQKKSKQPSPSRGSSDSEDPFLDNSPAAASATPGIRGRTNEDQVGNVAARLFNRANQGEPTRAGRRSSRAKSSTNSPASSRSASPTGSS